MPKTYRKSSILTRGLMEEVLAQYHTHLKDVSVIVDLIDAYDTAGGPAVMHHGLPAAAVVRVVPLKDRTMGRGDVEITFDGFVVGRMSDDEQRALIDHELYHLEIKRNKDGQIKLDDLGRTEFKLRPHDREFGWFDVIARRWGRHSLEVQQAISMVKDEEFRELYLTQRDKLDPMAEAAAQQEGQVAQPVHAYHAPEKPQEQPPQDLQVE